MNRKTSPRTPRSARRALPAFAVVALAIGLAACQTPPQGAAVVEKPAVAPVQVPAGIEPGRTADRLAEQLQRRVRDSRELIEQMHGMQADRIAEALERLDRTGTPKVHLGSWTDRILAQIEFEKAKAAATQRPERFKGMTADRIAEQVKRENGSLPKGAE